MIVSLAEFREVKLQTLQEMKIIPMFTPKRGSCNSTGVQIIVRPESFACTPRMFKSFMRSVVATEYLSNTSWREAVLAIFDATMFLCFLGHRCVFQPRQMD